MELVLDERYPDIKKTLVSERGIFWLEKLNSKGIDEALLQINKEVSVLRTFPWLL
jgi:hypothetical protein